MQHSRPSGKSASMPFPLLSMRSFSIVRRRSSCLRHGFEATNWFGVAAPKNTPPEITDKLNKEINAALAEPKMKAGLADLGAAALAGSPADFGKLISEEAEKWGKVIRAANIKPEG